MWKEFGISPSGRQRCAASGMVAAVHAQRGAGPAGSVAGARRRLRRGGVLLRTALSHDEQEQLLESLERVVALMDAAELDAAPMLVPGVAIRPVRDSSAADSTIADSSPEDSSADTPVGR